MNSKIDLVSLRVDDGGVGEYILNSYPKVKRTGGRGEMSRNL